MAALERNGNRCEEKCLGANILVDTEQTTRMCRHHTRIRHSLGFFASTLGLPLAIMLPDTLENDCCCDIGRKGATTSTKTLFPSPQDLMSPALQRLCGRSLVLHFPRRPNPKLDRHSSQAAAIVCHGSRKTASSFVGECIIRPLGSACRSHWRLLPAYSATMPPKSGLGVGPPCQFVRVAISTENFPPPFWLAVACDPSSSVGMVELRIEWLDGFGLPLL